MSKIDADAEDNDDDDESESENYYSLLKVSPIQCLKDDVMKPPQSTGKGKKQTESRSSKHH